MEPRGPAVHDFFVNMGGRGEMIKTPMCLQDLRRRIYAKAKTEPSWRFWAKARQRQGFGWKRWSSRWLYEAREESVSSMNGSHNPWHEVSRRA